MRQDLAYAEYYPTWRKMIYQESKQETAEQAKRPANTEMIAWARALTKKFGEQTAVEDLNFDIPRGSIFGFIGPSGCGKTTTIRLLTGI